MSVSEKSYEKLISYVKGKILDGNYKAGDKLEPERDLALKLEISRNSVREGMRILERMGIIQTHQGSGNYITTAKFADTLTEVMSMMYTLNEMGNEQIGDFRYTLEYGAMCLATGKATESQKQKLLYYMEQLEKSKTLEEQVANEKIIHYVIMEASHNDYLIANLRALNKIMDMYIPTMRFRVIDRLNQGADDLMNAHRGMVEAVVEGDKEKGIAALEAHFRLIREAELVEKNRIESEE